MQKWAEGILSEGDFVLHSGEWGWKESKSNVVYEV